MKRVSAALASPRNATLAASFNVNTFREINVSRLQDKVALITGGANGLGEAIAQRMSEEGCAVLILSLIHI